MPLAFLQVANLSGALDRQQEGLARVVAEFDRLDGEVADLHRQIASCCDPGKVSAVLSSRVSVVLSLCLRRVLALPPVATSQSCLAEEAVALRLSSV